MSHLPISESRAVDDAAPWKRRWRRWLRLFGYLMPVWCVVLASIDVFALEGLPRLARAMPRWQIADAYGLPGWHVAEALSLITGVVCILCGERRAALVCFGILALVFMAEPSLEHAT
jgi:hypothetical protein